MPPASEAPVPERTSISHPKGAEEAACAGTVLSVFRIHPIRVDGIAMFARALSRQLDARGWRSILCFPSPPVDMVRQFIDGPNVSFETEPEFESGNSAAAAALRRLLRRTSPDVVHLHYLSPVSPLPWVARTEGVRKIFFTDHASGREEPPPPRSFIRRVAAELISWPVGRIIYVSRTSLEERLVLKQVSRRNSCLISNGVDLERVAASRHTTGFRERFGIPADRLVITHISWLIPEKGGADFLRAARIVLDACPNTHFIMAGAGPCLDEYRETAAQSGIASRCTFTGEVIDPFTEGVFAASDIVCQPSRWREAFCWVAAEALAFGKPVVATKSGALAEVVRHGETGFIVNCRDVGALAGRLIELARDAELRDRMGRAAMQSVAERFSLERNIGEHLRLYGI